MSAKCALASKSLGLRLLLTIVLLSVVLLGCQDQEKPTLRFSAIPDQDQTRLQERFERVAEYLSGKLDVPVAYVPVKDYAATIIAFRNDQVQLAWFGGLSGVQARRLVPGSQAIAQGVEDRAFHSYFIANASTGLMPVKKFPRGIAGKAFTFGAKDSTSGRLMPEYYIRQHLGVPDEVFSRVGFSGDHSQTIALVQSGAYQIGAVNYQVWKQELADDLIDTHKVRVIWKTPPFPDYQWTIRGDVDKTFGRGFKARVQTALLQMNDPKLLATFPRSGFVKAGNAAYTPIFRVAKDIGLID